MGICSLGTHLVIGQYLTSVLSLFVPLLVITLPVLSYLGEGVHTLRNNFPGASSLGWSLLFATSVSASLEFTICLAVFGSTMTGSIGRINALCYSLYSRSPICE